MAPCGSPTDMLIRPRWAGGVIGANRAFSRANGKSVSWSVRRGLNIDDHHPLGTHKHTHEEGTGRTTLNAGWRGSCRSLIQAILSYKLAFHNKAIGPILQGCSQPPRQLLVVR